MCGNNVLELNRALIQEGLMLIFVEVLMCHLKGQVSTSVVYSYSALKLLFFFETFPRLIRYKYIRGDTLCFLKIT